MHKSKTNKAFTVIEVLFAVAILVTISAIGISALREFGRAHVLSSATDAVVSGLVEARAKTLASEGGQVFGVHFDQNQAIIFTESYVAGSTSNKELLPTSEQIVLGPISIAGGYDVIFKKISGETDNFGSVTLNYGTTNASTTIIIERTGNVTIDE